MSCYRSCNDVVKFDTGDNVTLLQTKPSLLCQCYRSCNDVVKFDTGDNVTLLDPYCVMTGVVMMW